MSNQRRHRSRGLMLTDLVIGMGVIAIVLTSLAYMLGDTKRAVRLMAARREAVRAADRNLILHNSGFINDLEAKAEFVADGDIVPGYSWKKVIITVDGQTKTVYGLTNDKPIREQAPDPGKGGGQVASR